MVSEDKTRIQENILCKITRKEELKPPVRVTGEVEYVVRAFNDLIKNFKKLESKLKESKK